MLERCAGVFVDAEMRFVGVEVRFVGVEMRCYFKPSTHTTACSPSWHTPPYQHTHTPQTLTRTSPNSLSRSKKRSSLIIRLLARLR